MQGGSTRLDTRLNKDIIFANELTLD
jgi:hypothetical protein